MDRNTDNSKENILIVQTGFLGDVLLSTPVIAAVREIYPNAKISFLTTPAAKSFLVNHPELSEVIEFDKRKGQSGFRGLLSLAKKLRSKKFTTAFSLHKSYRTALLLKLAAIKKRYGFEESKFSFLYTNTVKRSDLPHEVLRNLAIFRNLGIDPSTLVSPLSLYLSNAAMESAAKLITDINRPIASVAPGSVWATKRWTPEGFTGVINALVERGYFVLLLGGPEDKDIGQQIFSNIEEGSKQFVKNLISQTSLQESSALIGTSKIIISNDSSPLHIASSLGTPVVAIFCATIPEFGFTPWMVKHRIVEKLGLECRPCGRHGGNTCPTGTHACQKEVLLENVITAADELLGEIDKSLEFGTS